MQPRKALAIIVISSIVVVGFAVGFAFLTFDGIEQDVDLRSRGIQLPDWNLNMSDGSSQSLHSLRGRFLVVDLMATWCTTCSIQNDNLKTLYNDMSDSIHLISLTIDGSETEVMMAAYKEDNDLSWPHGLDTQSVFLNYFNVQYIPSIVIIDDEGYLRWYHVGLWSEPDMTETLALMMA